MTDNGLQEWVRRNSKPIEWALYAVMVLMLIVALVTSILSDNPCGGRLGCPDTSTTVEK